MPYGIPEPYFSSIIAVVAGFTEVEALYLFGSRAKGVYRPGSDIDLALAGNLPYNRYLQLSAALDDLDYLWKTDLVTLQTLTDPAFADSIKHSAVLLYKKTPEADPAT